ncbi:MAG TPA: MarR family winged helix-turn-helix transcriptional regulator [Gaiellaceae bacterium]|nr:MarR family winged helix-turn-helix transcriptional regulator [Gaiellaceae bacterium]
MSARESRGRNVLFRLFILGQLANDLLDQAMADGKLNPNDFAVASAIRAFQPVTPSRLAALLGMRPTTLSSYLRRLEERRQIKRRPNPDDGRSFLLETTKIGDRNVVASFPALRGSIARVHEQLDYAPKELDLALDRLEDALRRVLSRPDESARPPARRAPRRVR